MRFNAQTSQARAEMAKLARDMKALQAAQAGFNAAQNRVLNTGLAGRPMANMHFNMRNELSQLDALAQKIQKGKINQKEFTETIRGTNKMYEYQNALQRASLSNISAMSNGRMRTGINVPEMQQQTQWMRRTAADWGTMSMAARAYGRSVMDVGKNMAFMGRQAMLSVTAPIALVVGGAAAAFYKADQQLTDLAKVYGDSAGGMVANSNDIRDAARGMAQEMNDKFGTAQKDTLALATSFAALGESGKNLDYMVAAAGRLMRLGDVSVESSTKMISTLRTVFGLEGEALEGAINMANTFENQSTLSMQDFADALPKMGAIVKSWGGDIKQSGMILEGFTRSGIPAVEGANALKAGFTKLVRPTTKLEGKFADITKQFGGMTEGMSLTGIVKEMDGDVPKILEKIGELQKAQGWDDYTKKNFAAELWGAYQLNRGMALTENLANPSAQMQKLKDMSDKELADYNKATADREVAVQMQSASAQFKQTLNNIQMMAEKFGESVLPKITAALNGVINFGKAVVNGGAAILDALGPVGDILEGIGKYAIIAAAAFGPLMLLLSSGFLIKGGLITAMGVMSGLMAKMRGRGTGQPIFQTGQQRAAQLMAQQMTTTQNAQTSATTALTAAVQRLSAAYSQMQSSQASAASAGARLAAATRAQNARMTSTTQQQTSAIIAQTQAQRSAQRVGASAPTTQHNAMGGLMLNRANMLNTPEARTRRSQERIAANNARLAAQRAAAPVIQPAVVPSGSRGIAQQAKIDAKLYNKMFSADARSFVSRGTGGAAVNPMQNASAADRRAAAGIGIGAGSPSLQRGRVNNDAGAQAATNMRNQARAAAEVAAHQENAQRNASALNARLRDGAGTMGGLATTAGLMTSMLGGTNKVAMILGQSLMVVGTAAMLLPGLFAAAGVKIAAATAGIRAMVAGSTVATRAFAVMGATIRAAMLPLGIAAAVLATAYGAYRIATSGARALKEENDKIKGSVESWSDVLGYTVVKFGQVKNAAGEVVDTAASIENEIKNDETLSALVEKLKREGDNVNSLTADLEREAVKMFASGANKEQVTQAIEGLMGAANLSPVVKDKLRVQFANIEPTGLNGASLSDSMTDQISTLLTDVQGRTASLWQQKGFGTGWFGLGFGGDQGWDLTSDVDANSLSEQAKTEIDNIYNQLQNSVMNAKPEQKGDLLKNFINSINSDIRKSLSTLSPEVNKAIEAQGGILNIDADAIGDQFSLPDEAINKLKYQQNVVSEIMSRMKTDFGISGMDDAMAAMFSTTGGAAVAMAYKTNSAILSTQQAMDQFAGLAHQMGDAWNNMSDEQKTSIMNMYRAAAGLEDLSEAEAKSAMSAGSFGNANKRAGSTAVDLAAQAEGAEGQVDELGNALDENHDAEWSLKLDVDMGQGVTANMSVQELVDMQKDTMGKVRDDYMDEMAAEAQIQFDAQKRAFQQQQQAAQDALQETQSMESKALEKSQEAEKKNFDKNWDARIENEKKGFEDRIKAIEDTQDAEDELERQRKRNAEREERRMKYMQSLMQSGIDLNIAMAGGNLDEVARLSLNAGVAANDYNKENVEAEAGYKKEDEDKARSTAIEQIKEEENARIESLTKQKEMEQEAMNERLAMQSEELQKKHAAQSAYLQRRQEDENIAYEISFQANQRALNRELEALRTQIPLNEAELNSHMARVQGAYDGHGVNLMSKGDQWSKTIEDGLIRHIDAARAEISNQQKWQEYGNRVAEGVSSGAFNMNSADFNKFLRTGEMPGAASGVSTPQNSNAGQRGNGSFTRHGGGPLSNDKYNNRAGIPKNAPMRSNEVSVLAQRDEFVMRGKAHKKYGTRLMNRINQGQAIIRHEGGPTGSSYASRHEGGPVDEKVRHEGGPVDNLGAMAAAMQGAAMGAIVQRSAFAMGTAMMNAVQAGLSEGAFVGEGAAKAAVEFARGESGKPYQYAGVGNPSWDCSGFMGGIWAILTGKNPKNRWFSTETFNGAPNGTLGMQKGLAPDFPNGFSLGFSHGGGGPNSHVAGTLLGTPVESGGNGVRFGAGALGANASQFHDFWHLPGVSGKPPASTKPGGFQPVNPEWTTPGIQKYGQDAMTKFAPPSSEGGGGTMGEVLTGNKEFYIKEIVAEAKRRGMDKDAAIIALMTAMQESSLLMYANANVPASLALPHDAVGRDHDSVGLFQQRGSGWGSLEQRMNARASAGSFYNALSKFDYHSMGKGAAAQKVQVSAYPDAYNKWQGDATAQANRYFDQGGIAQGLGFMPKNTIKPERVLSPQQTRSFDALIPMLNGLANQGVVKYDDIITTLYNDGSRLANQAVDLARAAYNEMPTEQQQQIIFELKNANINGVDDLDRRFKVWGEEIMQRVKQEAIDKARRVGATR